MDTVLFFWNLGDRGVKLTTHFHLEPRLRMSDAIAVLPLYAFMAWSGILPFIVHKRVLLIKSFITPTYVLYSLYYVIRPYTYFGLLKAILRGVKVL
jgi:hypothetical protein